MATNYPNAPVTGKNGRAMDPGIEEGIRLFNNRKFFEAHEALEAVWLKARGEEKTFLHGLIQIAAAFHHHTRHNPAGFRSLLEKGWRKIGKFGEEKDRLDLAALRRQLEPWREILKRPQALQPASAPPLPCIQTTRSR